MSKWISVNDRLPAKGGVWDEFLVVCKTHGGYQGGYISIKIAEFHPDMPAENGMEEYTHYWELKSDMDVPFDITHWMPMPRLPKEK